MHIFLSQSVQGCGQASMPNIYEQHKVRPNYNHKQSMLMREGQKHRTMSRYELRKQQELAEQVAKERRHQETLKRDASAMIQVIKVSFPSELWYLVVEFPAWHKKD